MKINEKIKLATALFVFGSPCLFGDVVLNDTFDSDGENYSWYSSYSSVIRNTENGSLKIILGDPSYRTVYKNVDASLDVGKKLSVHFELTRDYTVGGALRVFLRSSDESMCSYCFHSSLGEADDTRIGITTNGSMATAGVSSFYLQGGSSASVAGTDRVSVYQFDLTLVTENTIRFDAYQDSLLLASTTETFDNVDRSFSELLKSFDRVFIGWTNTGASATDSIQLDNVAISLLPGPNASGGVATIIH